MVLPCAPHGEGRAALQPHLRQTAPLRCAPPPPSASRSRAHGRSRAAFPQVPPAPTARCRPHTQNIHLPHWVIPAQAGTSVGRTEGRSVARAGHRPALHRTADCVPGNRRSACAGMTRWRRKVRRHEPAPLFTPDPSARPSPYPRSRGTLICLPLSRVYVCPITPAWGGASMTTMAGGPAGAGETSSPVGPRRHATGDSASADRPTRNPVSARLPAREGRSGRWASSPEARWSGLSWPLLLIRLEAMHLADSARTLRALDPPATGGDQSRWTKTLA